MNLAAAKRWALTVGVFLAPPLLLGYLLWKGRVAVPARPAICQRSLYSLEPGVLWRRLAPMPCAGETVSRRRGG